MTSPFYRNPSFRHYVAGRVATTVASQMMMVILAWQMYDLTGNPFDLGLAGLAQFMPSLLLTLVVGQVADRFDRRHVLVLCLIGQLAVAAALIAGTTQGWLNRDAILLASFASGIAKAFQMPTQQALAPQLVPAESLPRALAIVSSGTQAAIIVGPAIGGFLYVAGAHIVYLLCSVLFAGAAASIFCIRTNLPPRTREPVTLQNLFAGFAFIRRRKDILGAISLDLFAVLFGGAVALLPVFAKDILHVGPWGLGMLRGASAGGALLTSIYLARWPITRNAGKIMFGSVALYGVATLVFGLSTSFALSLLALTLAGMFDMVSVVIRQSLVQLDTPDDMRGRVSAVNSVFIGASNQLGEFESGVAATWFGVVPSVVIGGLGTLAVAAAWTKLFPSLVRRDSLVPLHRARSVPH